MKTYFIGGFCPKERMSEFLKNSKGLFSYSANNFSYGFINGLLEYIPDLNLISVPFLGNFPFSYKKIYQKKSSFVYDVDKKGFCVGSLRLPIIGLYSRYINIYSYLKKHIKNDEESYFIVSSVYTPILKALVRLKNENNGIKICLIVPDLPNYVSSTKNPLYWFFKKIELSLIKKLYGEIDSFVVLTDEMYNILPINKKPWIRIEGVYCESNSFGDVYKEESDKVILYTGTLDRRFGIENLLNAFSLILDENYKLWICGEGNSKNSVIEHAKKDKRITYHGQISTKDVYLLQRKATVLINPRTSEGDYTKYSFPSKTMEYLASGTPCIMNKLPGIPKEYDDYIFYPKDESIESLRDIIITVCDLDEDILNKKGINAQRFILENKVSKVLMKKLVELLNN